MSAWFRASPGLSGKCTVRMFAHSKMMASSDRITEGWMQLSGTFNSGPEGWPIAAILDASCYNTALPEGAYIDIDNITISSAPTEITPTETEPVPAPPPR